MQPVQSLFPLDRPPQDAPAHQTVTPGAAIAAFERLGATTELIACQTIVFCDAPDALRRLLARHPIQADPL